MVHDVLESDNVANVLPRQHMLCALIGFTQTAVCSRAAWICHPKRPGIAGVSEKSHIL